MSWFKKPPCKAKQLFSWISDGVKRAADKRELVISPIGRCWMSLPMRKRPYAGDDYHPSNRDLNSIAKTLASSFQATALGKQATKTRRIGACPWNEVVPLLRARSFRMESPFGLLTLLAGTWIF